MTVHHFTRKECGRTRPHFLFLPIGWMVAVLLCACTHRLSGLKEYHEALSLMERGDAPAALKQLERAGELARIDSLRALVESQKGTLYFSQRMLDRSLESYRRAYDIDLRARDTVGLIYDLRDMGNVLRATEGHEDSCIVYFEKARRLALLTENTPMLRDVESQMAGYYLWRNQLDKARDLLIPALKHLDEDNQSGLLFMMADLYHRSGHRDSATYYYRQLLSRGTIGTRQAAHRALAEYALADGKTTEALTHLQQYEQLTDSVHKQNNAEAVRQTAALYDYTLRQQQAARLRNLLTVAIASALLLALLLLTLLLYFSRRRMNYRLKLQRLEQLLERSSGQKAGCDDNADKEDKDKDPEPATSAIRQKIDHLLSDARQPAMSDDDFLELEEYVDRQWPGFLHRLQEFCRLSPQERHVCLLLKTGIAPIAIAQLTAHTKQSITNTRSRLFRKTFGRTGTPAEWDAFIHSL